MICETCKGAGQVSRPARGARGTSAGASVLGYWTEADPFASRKASNSALVS